MLQSKYTEQDVPGGPVVGTPPASSGDPVPALLPEDATRHETSEPCATTEACNPQLKKTHVLRGAKNNQVKLNLKNTLRTDTHKTL